MKKYTIKRPVGIPTTFLGNSHRYKTELGEISCVHPCTSTQHMFEIYCISGNLFDDIERYPSKPEAEARIYELLVPPSESDFVPPITR